MNRFRASRIVNLDDVNRRRAIARPANRRAERGPSEHPRRSVDTPQSAHGRAATLAQAQKKKLSLRELRGRNTPYKGSRRQSRQMPHGWARRLRHAALRDPDLGRAFVSRRSLRSLDDGPTASSLPPPNAEHQQKKKKRAIAGPPSRLEARRCLPSCQRHLSQWVIETHILSRSEPRFRRLRARARCAESLTLTRPIHIGGTKHTNGSH